ncbi:antibiotic biosynthesis monooxygenase [Acidisoma cellulosilytica]|uniref:Antibiotic biosynthesis monooxygenase n=1 Tax=Acidisoma cellulosilyticum TaxID=2802395 RepID=A0A964E2J7_9PROT|nr:antibiotic biosynthesis monooxygenase [Acidisoma cellulosilyticum]MCB8879374.1 antibiotic biosynthesis monooxygenase [Acidisoma cellulosilyticum]
MISSTTILRAKPGYEGAIREALLDLADFIQSDEPETVDFRILSDEQDAAVFTLLGRFTTRDALHRHLNAELMERFLWAARSMLDGPMTLSMGEEIFAKTTTP